MNIVIIGEKTDRFIPSFVSYCRTKKIDVSHLNFDQASKVFNIRLVNAKPDISPKCKLLLRTTWSENFSTKESRDGQFIQSEINSMIWSICRLMPMTVVNRPSEQGLRGNLTELMSIDETSLDLERRSEVYVSSAIAIPQKSKFWMQCWKTNERRVLTSDTAREFPGPARLRELIEKVKYVSFIVIGKTCFKVSSGRSDRDKFFHNLTKGCTTKVGLDFFSITWGFSDSSSLFMVAEIDPNPVIPSDWRLQGRIFSAVLDLVSR